MEITIALRKNGGYMPSGLGGSYVIFCRQPARHADEILVVSRDNVLFTKPFK